MALERKLQQAQKAAAMLAWELAGTRNYEDEGLEQVFAGAEESSGMMPGSMRRIILNGLRLLSSIPGSRYHAEPGVEMGDFLTPDGDLAYWWETKDESGWSSERPEWWEEEFERIEKENRITQGENTDGQSKDPIELRV